MDDCDDALKGNCLEEEYEPCGLNANASISNDGNRVPHIV